MIPKIIHHIWVGDFKLPNREKNLIENIKNIHSDYEHKFWTTSPDLPENIKHWYDIFYKIKNYAFCADILRVWIINTYGGFYFDVDWDIKKRVDDFLKYDGVFFYHNDTDFTIPNNIFASQAQSPVLEYCLSRIVNDCSWYGPSWFGTVIKDYLKIKYESEQHIIKNLFKPMNIEYYQYYQFEITYGKHLSLYSWSPENWTKLNRGEELN